VVLGRGQTVEFPQIPRVNIDALGLDCLVLGGPFLSGGDERAMESPPARLVTLESFVIQRYPIRNLEFLRFLNALVEEGRVDEAQAWSPRARMGSGSDADETRCYAWDGGCFSLGGPAGRDWSENEPVVLVTPVAAEAYASWWAERTGLPWRLPFELEWEKAARGVDARPFAWGHHVEAPWANLLNHSEAPQHRTEVGQFEIDRSVYGVMDLGGNVRDICADAFVRGGAPIQDGRPGFRRAVGDELHTVKGGSWTSVANLSRCAVRFVIGREQRFSSVGFRLVRTLGPVTSEPHPSPLSEG
jgi:serine/threonine-protein kinase